MLIGTRYMLLFLSSLAVTMPARGDNNMPFSDAAITAIIFTGLASFLVGTALTYMLTAKEKTLAISGGCEMSSQEWKTVTSKYHNVVVQGGLKFVFPSTNHTAGFGNSLESPILQEN